MVILNSARKHGISEEDMLTVASEALVVLQLRDEPKKLLLLGFDTKGRALEIVTDTGDDGVVFLIHADKITKSNESLLQEVL
jgi:hypothetical protein